MTDKVAGPDGSALTEGLGLAPERDEVLRQLDDRTNQTWAGKRARWAKLVRAQDAEIERLRACLREVLEFQSDPKAPTIHDFGRWRRAAESL